MSSKTGYTKGPWYVEDADASVPVCAESDGMLVAYVDYTRVRRNPVEYSANARLIAAAPELLEACKDAAILLEEMGHKDLVTAIDLRAAIAKAMGGSDASL